MRWCQKQVVITIISQVDNGTFTNNLNIVSNDFNKKINSVPFAKILPIDPIYIKISPEQYAKLQNADISN